MKEKHKLKAPDISEFIMVVTEDVDQFIGCMDTEVKDVQAKIGLWESHIESQIEKKVIE